jgi:hypothetical protein
MAHRAPLRPTARIEEAIGFVGMFGILFLGATVFCEVTGRPALGWALTLLVCVLAVVALDRWRVAVLRRTDPADGIGALPAGRAAAAPPVSRADAPAVAADGRVHRHVGWDELAPAGRRAQRSASHRVAAPARTGHAADVTRPSDG